MAKPNKIYIDLDSILDTRLGTLLKLNEEAATKALEGNYLTRDRDEFNNVNLEEYKLAYSNRDFETLTNSKITNIFKFLIPKLIIPRLNKTNPALYTEGLSLEVNTYPYRLSSGLCEEIAKAISVWLEGIVPVNMVYLDIPSRTPLLCKNSYIAIISYEHEGWLNYHYNCNEWSSMEEMAARVTRLPNTPYYTPGILSGQSFKLEDLSEDVRKVGHPLKAYAFMVSLLIKLEFIDVEYFSIIKPNNE